MSGLTVQQMDISRRLRIGTALQSMFLIIQHLDIHGKLLRQSAPHRIDRSVANSLKAVLCAVVRINHFHMRIKFTVDHIAQIIHTQLPEMKRLLPVQIFLPEVFHYLIRGNLPLLLGYPLNHIRKLPLHGNPKKR